MMRATDHMHQVALRYLEAGKRAALATVIRTWGSAPRGVGAQMAIADDGAFEGSVSGGCVEGAVILEAQEVLKTGTPRLLHYGVADQDAFAVGLACGGEITILVDPVDTGQGLPRDMLAALAQAEETRGEIGYEIDLTDWTRREIAPRTDQSQLQQSQLQEDRFRFVIRPPVRLIIVGAVHIAQHLARMAQGLGYEVILIDPREGFARSDRFEGVDLRIDWPDDVIGQIALDGMTALVTLTHDPKIDLPALEAVLGAPLFYIGALGSTRTHAKRCEMLAEAGFSAEQIARIDGPVGLDIGASNPAEIALATLAELVARLRKAGMRKVTPQGTGSDKTVSGKAGLDA